MGCGRRDPKRDMLRIVGLAGEGLRFDAAQRAGGRGGYLHRREDCWNRFGRRKGMIRSLRVAADSASRAALVQELRLHADR